MTSRVERFAGSLRFRDSRIFPFGTDLSLKQGSRNTTVLGFLVQLHDQDPQTRTGALELQAGLGILRFRLDSLGFN